MPDYAVMAEDEEGNRIPYTMYSRNPLSKAEVKQYFNAYLDSGETKDPVGANGNVIRILPPSMQGSKRDKLGRAYEDNIAAPISRTMRGLASNSQAQQVAGMATLGLASRGGIDPSQQVLAQQNPGEVGKEVLGAVSSGVESITDDPATLVGIGVSAATAGFTGGSTLSPIVKLGATKYQRFTQMVLPALTSGAATGITQYATDPKVTANTATETALKVGALELGLNIAAKFLPKFAGENLEKVVNANTFKRIQDSVEKSLGKPLVSNNVDDFMKSTFKEIDNTVEMAFKGTVDELGDRVAYAANNNLASNFKQTLLDLKDEYIKFSKLPLNDPTRKETAEKIFTLLNTSKQIALQSQDDILPLLLAQDRELVADMMRRGYIDKEGAQALLRAEYTVKGKASGISRVNARTLDPSTRAAVEEYIKEATGQVAKLRQAQQVAALQEWQQSMEGVLQNVSEYSQFKQVLEHINKAGINTAQLRRDLVKTVNPDNSEQLKGLLNAIYDQEVRNITQGDLKAGFTFQLTKKGKPRNIGTGSNYLPSSGITGLLPGSSGAINATTVKIIRAKDRNNRQPEQ